MMRHLQALTLVLAAAAAPLAAHASTIVYSTGFESPGFAPGNLNGQGGWFQDFGATTSVTVQTAVVQAGSQALSLASAGQPDFTRGAHLISFNPVASPEKTLQVSFDFNITFAGNNSEYRASLFANSNTLSDLILMTDGRIGVFGPAGFTVSPLAHVDRDDAWHRIDAFFDFVTLTVDLFYDNVPVMNDVVFSAAPVTGVVNGFAFQMLPGNIGSDTMYVDNLTLASTVPAQAVPEPQTLALTLCALALLGLQSRRGRAG